MLRKYLSTFVICSLAVIQGLAVAQNGRDTKFRRAKHPDFGAADDTGVFFDDVFSKVTGSRPANLSAPVVAAPGTSPTTASGGTSTPASSGSFAWSKLIDAATIEDEIKAINLKLDQSVSTPTQFRSRDYKLCRKYFSVLAMLFGIIEEYDSDVRWKKEATSLRDAFSRSAGNCKTGSDQAYKEAKIRKQDLQDAVRGGTVNVTEGKPRENWEHVIDRSPLMQRLETSLQGKLQPFTANQQSFSENAEEILREAQLVAVMGEVLQKEGMMDSDDDDYNSYAEEMKQAALEIVEAVKSGNQAAASSAAGKISQSCSVCHESYRG